MLFAGGWYGTVRYGMVWYGMVWYGMVRYGMAWYGMVDVCGASTLIRCWDAKHFPTYEFRAVSNKGEPL